MGGFFIGLGIGLGIGVSIWFPYNYYLKRVLKARRTATSALNELSMSDTEHMAFMSPKAPGSYQWTPPGPGTVYTSTSPVYTSGTSGNISQTTSAQSGGWTHNFSGLTTSSANLYQGYQELADLYRKTLGTQSQTEQADSEISEPSTTSETTT